MAGKAIVIGGSIGGLFAAAALARAGWEVAVAERSATELSGRGAGIVTHPELISALEAVGAGTQDLGVAVCDRVAIDIDGRPVRRLPYPQVVTSWDRIQGLLRAMIPEGCYHLDRGLTETWASGSEITARFADGGQMSADLVVGADGYRSVIRRQFHPRTEPVYAGYVVWRAVIDETMMPADIHAQLSETFAMFLPSGTQALGYPIAGPDNDLRRGRRRYNLVWYCRTDHETLADMLTDNQGHRHDLSIPPPSIRADIRAEMQRQAQCSLPAAFAKVLGMCDAPFFTPIYDLCSPTYGQGRVALVGDAASVARPHLGMGVTKAGEDALALAGALQSEISLPKALAAYSARREPFGRRAVNRARALGALIFDGDPRANPKGAPMRYTDTILLNTASTNFSEDP